MIFEHLKTERPFNITKAIFFYIIECYSAELKCLHGGRHEYWKMRCDDIPWRSIFPLFFFFFFLWGWFDVFVLVFDSDSEDPANNVHNSGVIGSIATLFGAEKRQDFLRSNLSVRASPIIEC